MTSRSLPLGALLGALVATLLGVLPFSALADGFVDGSLHGRRGAAVGPLSGAFAAVPKAGLLFLLAALFGAVSPAGGTRLLVQFLVASAAVVALLGVEGALAGYLGVYFGLTWTDRRSRRRSSTGGTTTGTRRPAGRGGVSSPPGRRPRAC